MGLSDYEGKMASVASIQRQLDGQLDSIRGNRNYSDSGRKTEMAKAVLAARTQVDKGCVQQSGVRVGPDQRNRRVVAE